MSAGRDDDLIKRVSTLRRRAIAASGASLLALVAESQAARAQQAQPGSAQCPIADQVVTCTGSIPNGFNGGNTPFNRLVVRDLTSKITPPNSTSGIIVRNHDATIEADSSVDIAVTNNSNLNSLTAGILMESGAYSLTSNASISAAGRLATAGIGYRNQSSRSDIVHIVNNGAIAVSGGDFNNGISVANAGILIDSADGVSVQNAGSITASGPYVTGILVRGNIPNVVDVEIINTGSIRIDDSERDLPSEGGGTRNFANAIDVTNPFLRNLTIRNSGTIEGGVIHYQRPDFVQTGSPGTTTVLVENSGSLIESGIFLYDQIIGSPPSIYPLDANIYDISLSNSGTLSDSMMHVAMHNVQGADVAVRNEGPISVLDQSAILIELVVGPSAAGPSEAEVINDAPLTVRSGNSEFGTGIEVKSGRSSIIENQGEISLDGFGVTGLDLRQGVFGDPIAAGCCIESEGAFDGLARIQNSGGISGEGSNKIDGIVGNASADLLIENSGAIDLLTTTQVRGTGTSPAFGEVFGGPDNYGIDARSFGNIVVNSAAPISVSGNISAGIRFTLFEQRESEIPSSRENGFIDVTYDQSRDFASEAVINVTADSRAPGYQSFGIFGELSLTEDDVDRDGPGSEGIFAFERGGSSARINVADGVTVAGGTGPGSGIALLGGGTVFLDNRGTITNLGDAGTAAVILGPSTFNARFDSLEFDDEDKPIDITIRPGLTIDLADSTNSGDMVSTGGFGLRNANGRIVGFLNGGLVQGGEGSVGASGTSTVSNAETGILDGRISLDGGGSSLTNAGVIRTSGADFVTHGINGDYVQSASGRLILDAGTGGRDRMNVTGNFLLDGDFDVALGTPSSEAVVTVGGNLSLDGRINIADAGGYGPGVYRLFDYGGSLTDSGLAVGSQPDGTSAAVQTAVAQQVNIVVTPGDPGPGPGPTPLIQFWDGSEIVADQAIDGGTGNWNSVTANWTRANGEVNEAWNGNFAVFQGAPGTVTIDPAGISATGLQFAVGGYTIQGGPLTLNAPATVRVGDASAGGSAMTATIASTIGGAGGLIKTDLGTLVLTAANLYTGGTTISSGILQVAADSALGGAGSGLTLDGGTLRLAGAINSGRTVTAAAGGGTIDTQANTLTLSGPLQGAGAITKSGSGTLVLSGASTAFAGRLTTSAGGLRLDGSIGGTLEIGSGTTLSGTGALNNLIVAGTLSPGNSVGTLTASGNAIFRAGSTFAVELTAAGASDRLNVTGTATIEGGTVAVTALDPELNYTDGASYTFLSAAGGRTGTFAGLSESSAFLDFALGYTATTAFLTVDVIRTFPDVALTFNEVEAASALRELDRTAGSDSLAAYNAILLLDADPARAAFNLSSGEIYAAVMAASLRRSELVGDRFAARAHEAGGPGLGAWGAVSGHDGKVSGDGNGARFSHDGVGADLGIDFRGESWTVGVGGGWSKGDVELPARLSSADWDGWHIGAYAGLGSGNSGFSVTASALHMSGEADVRRAIAFGTIARTARAEVDTDTTALSLELRYGFPVGGGWAVGPAGSVGYADTDLDRFTEAGPASLALSGNGSSERWTSYAIGGFANLRNESGSIDATLLYGRNDDRRAEADLAIAGAPGQPFRVRASERGEDMAVLKLSGAYELGGGWTLGGNLRAATGSGEESITGQASLGLRF